MPAAAVIPAPIAYINAVAVKKLVIGFRGGRTGLLPRGVCTGLFVSLLGKSSCSSGVWAGLGPFTLRKLKRSKQAIALNTLAWNNKIGLWFYFVGF